MNVRFALSTLAPWAVAAGAALLGGCSDDAVPQAEVLRPVKTMLVESGAAALRDRVFSGSARSAEQAALSFKVSGTVAQVPVAVGDVLSRGDLIAALDRDTFDIELEQALAKQAQAEASRRNTEAEYQRLRQLYANDNASRNELDTALFNAESAIASYNAAVQSVRLARLSLSYTRLTVDAGCSVAKLNIEVHENINAGQTVAEVNCGSDWEVVLAVPESLIASFRDGIVGIARFPSVPGQSFPGVVTEVGIGTSNSRTFPVTLSLDTVPQDIRSNLAAEVTLQLSSRVGTEHGVYLPPAAVVEDEQGTFVLVVQPVDSGAAELQRRAVEIGEISELGLEVVAGLEVGERVVTAGQINARDGMRVRNP